MLRALSNEKSRVATGCFQAVQAIEGSVYRVWFGERRLTIGVKMSASAQLLETSGRS
jgi:hypothetical protein